MKKGDKRNREASMKDLYDKIASNFIASLSKKELDYCTHSDRDEYLGFSAFFPAITSRWVAGRRSCRCPMG